MANNIITCGYCGAQNVINIGAHERQELICSNCSAPLDVSSLKAAPSTRHEERPPQVAPIREEKKPSFKHEKRSKKKKTLSNRLFKKGLDILDDLFD